jgi:hypothetical protein
MTTNSPYSEAMTYLPPAARQFVTEVKAVRENAQIEPCGPPDGFGVVRSLSVDAETAEWLLDVLIAVNDSRIAEWTSEDDGGKVTFVSSHHADDASPFSLAEAEAILYELDDESLESFDGGPDVPLDQDLAEEPQP